MFRPSWSWGLWLGVAAVAFLAVHGAMALIGRPQPLVAAIVAIVVVAVAKLVPRLLFSERGGALMQSFMMRRAAASYAQAPCAPGPSMHASGSTKR